MKLNRWSFDVVSLSRTFAGTRTHCCVASPYREKINLDRGKLDYLEASTAL
jgi:hypothetical protein